MTSLQPIDVRLQISSFEEPIRGSLTDHSGRTVEFTGWIELSSALGEISGGNDPDDESIHTITKESRNGN